MKKISMEKVTAFLAGRGFYIVLFLCVAAIGISGYFLFANQLGNTIGDLDDEVPVGGHITMTIPTKPTITLPPVTPTPSLAPTQTTPPKSDPTGTPTSPNVKAYFIRPVTGEILKAFHNTELVYSATMGDWRTHGGIDIAAAVGTEVYAVSAGTVKEVTDDALMGTMVTIDHGDGLVSIYANLAAKPPVSVGDSVSAGDLVGTVGNTAIEEVKEPSHLHFEMQKDGKAMNPEDYLPKS